MNTSNFTRKKLLAFLLGAFTLLTVSLTSYGQVIYRNDINIQAGKHAKEVAAVNKGGLAKVSPVSTTAEASPLPFIESWASGNFTENSWSLDTTVQGNYRWGINTDFGNEAPAAEFYMDPSATNYSYAMATPMLNGIENATGNVTLAFDLYLDDYNSNGSEKLTIEVFDGIIWSQVTEFANTASIPWTFYSYNISQYALGHEFKVRFVANGVNSSDINWWQIDNIKIYENVLVNLSGNVTKATGGSSVQGATIIATSDKNTYTATTAEDGTYTIEMEAGNYDLKCKRFGFNNAIQDTVNIIENDIWNVALTTPVMKLDTLLIHETHNINDTNTTTKTKTIYNNGDGTLIWNAAILNNQDVVKIPAINGNFPRGTDPVSIERAPVVNNNPRAAEMNFKSSTSTGYAFNIYSGNTFFSFDTEDPATQNSISDITITPFGGAFGVESNDYMYIIDHNDNMLKKVDVEAGEVTEIGTAIPSGAESWTGLTCDRATGVFYASSTDASVSTIYTIDLTTGVATEIGQTGISGLIDIAIDGNGQMYGYCIVADASYAIDKTTGASTLLGSLGYDANYAQGMAWDPNTNIVYLAAYDNASGEGQLRSLDRQTGATTYLGSFGGEIDALSFPDELNGWLTVNPGMGTLAAGESQTVSFTFDPTDLVGDSTYTATVAFTSTPSVGTAIVNCVYEIVVGINENNPQDKVLVFPVPAKDYINIQAVNMVKNISIFNNIGEIVYTKTKVNNNKIQINVSNFTSGIYILKLETDKGFITTHITVK